MSCWTRVWTAAKVILPPRDGRKGPIPQHPLLLAYLLHSLPSTSIDTRLPTHATPLTRPAALERTFTSRSLRVELNVTGAAGRCTTEQEVTYAAHTHTHVPITVITEVDSRALALGGIIVRLLDTSVTHCTRAYVRE